jgi:hypothetical protein
LSGRIVLGEQKVTKADRFWYFMHNESNHDHRLQLAETKQAHYKKKTKDYGVELTVDRASDAQSFHQTVDAQTCRY